MALSLSYLSNELTDTIRSSVGLFADFPDHTHLLLCHIREYSLYLQEGLNNLTK